MPQAPEYHPLLVEQVREALVTRNLDAFGSLLGDDVRWGGDQHPRACRSRADVVATFTRIIAEGAEGKVMDIAAGPRGIVCELAVTWSRGENRSDERVLYHLYLVRDGRIVEIQPYDDRTSAEVAAGITPGMTCADCGCIVNRGIRLVTCGDDCCCRDLPAHA